MRAGLNYKLLKSGRNDDMKPLRGKGGKVLYRSLERPLKLYAHGMPNVDGGAKKHKDSGIRYVDEKGIPKRVSPKGAKYPNRASKQVVYNSTAVHRGELGPKGSPVNI